MAVEDEKNELTIIVVTLTKIIKYSFILIISLISLKDGIISLNR